MITKTLKFAKKHRLLSLIPWIVGFLIFTWFFSGFFIGTLPIVIFIVISLISTVLVASKFESMKEEIFILKKIVLLLYALNPKSEKELNEILRDRKPQPLPEFMESFLHATLTDKELSDRKPQPLPELLVCFFTEFRLTGINELTMDGNEIGQKFHPYLGQLHQELRATKFIHTLRAYPNMLREFKTVSEREPL